MVHHERRASDSPLVRQVARVMYTGGAPEIATPDGLWDLVIRRRQEQVTVLQTGITTRPVVLDYEPGDEYFSISFEPGVYMPRLLGSAMVDNAFFRPVASKTAFWLDGDRLEIPSFENAEGLVSRLVARGHLVPDPVVAQVLRGDGGRLSPRTVQRHFLRAVGLPPKQLELIQRANRAVELLRRGMPAVTVAMEVGYSDQSHMTRSLKRTMGQTPGEIARTCDPYATERSVAFVQDSPYTSAYL